ncbi:preprotein translocase subunit SecD [Sphingobium subterraneum]|uniref:Preprotein translocase subunit SecD n=1 Tax=Sphingobium subterraneum TaxID=627688 RepID=A0A841J2X7_9SPHN|nr:preprotein translocase subunit SecD [Sphingobium subterraneum]
MAKVSSSGDALSLLLTDAGRQVVAIETAKHVGKDLALRLGGQVIMNVRVHEPITGGSFQIAGLSPNYSKRILAAVRISCPLPSQLPFALSRD